MKSIQPWFEQIVSDVPPEIKAEVDLQFDVSQRVYDLMIANGLNKKQLAERLHRRPSEITKWLSGQHNFTLKTIAMLSVFFGEPIVTV